MYLLLLVISVIYLYYLKNVTKLSVIIICYLPIAFLFFILPATQYGVGTDYFTYRGYYFSPEQLDIYIRKGELLFYYMYYFVVHFNLGSQGIFYLTAAFNTIVFFITLNKLRGSGFKVWLVFLIFFTVTNIYHNQMNGLRQYMAVMCFPLIFIYCVENRYMKSFIIFICAILSHSSAVLATVFYPLTKLAISNKKLLFAIFISLPFLYYFSGNLILYIITNYFHKYAHYIGSDYAQGISLLNFFTKLYYLPVFLLFWLNYIKAKENSIPSKYDIIIDNAIIVWVFSYWLIVPALQFGFLFRLMSLFIFFYIFPLYFYLNLLITRKNHVEFTLIITYLILPYLLKIIVFAKGEYLYSNYLM